MHYLSAVRYRNQDASVESTLQATMAGMEAAIVVVIRRQLKIHVIHRSALGRATEHPA
jgi:hypothetical protein